MRLQKYMAKSGVASRRKSEEIITAGRVKVNGIVVKEMGYIVKENDKLK
jgi:23S rRNA pseudouridine2605 synthase